KRGRRSRGELARLGVEKGGNGMGVGYNGNGQLGDGTTMNRLTPVQVTGLHGVIAVAAGTQYSLALKSDGTVWAWGNNGSGEFGNGTTTSSSVPVRTGTTYDAVAVSAGASDAVALRADGTVWDWGNNSYGQVGDGTVTIRDVAVQPQPGVSNAIAVAAGQNDTFAVKMDGTTWAWGQNNYGQLGDGTTMDRHTPVLSNFADALSVAAGNHTLVLTGDG